MNFLKFECNLKKNVCIVFLEVRPLDINIINIVTIF